MKHLLFVFGVLMGCAVVTADETVTNAEARSADTVLAILPGVGATAPPEQAVAQWEVACSQDAGFALVERALIRKVLAEQSLAAGGMTGANSLTLGRLLAADLFVFIDRLPSTNAIEVCRARVVEAATGLLLKEEVWDVHAAPKTPDHITHFVRAAAAKRAVPIADRHFVGLLGVRSEESGRRLDETAQALDFLVPEALSIEPKVTILDREHLEHLQTERALTDAEQHIKKAAYLVNVGLRAVAEKDRLSAAILLQSLTGGPTLTTNVVVSALDIEEARWRIVDAVSALLQIETASPSAPLGDARAEAGVYAAQASLWLTWGDYDNAARLAGTAFALESSQSNRLFWARALNRQTSLAAILRARELLSDYYDVHIKAIEENRETDLMLPHLGFAYIPAFVPADDDETIALKEAIMEADDRMFRRRLSHYAKHYDALWNPHYNGSPYWTTWRERTMAVDAYYLGRPGKHIELLREAANAFTISPPSQYDEMVTDRLAMLGDIAMRMHRSSGAYIKCDQRVFIPLFQELTRHQDPGVRLLAHFALNQFDIEPTQCARSVFDILLKELTPAHPYRNYWHAEWRLFHYVSILQNIHPSAASDILEAKAQILHAIVASDDPKHFDSVMTTPVKDKCGIGWLMELSANNQVNQADSLAKQLIDLYERKHIKNPYTDAHKAMTELIALRQPFAKPTEQASVETAPPTNAAVWDQFEFIKLHDADPSHEASLVLVETDQLYCVKSTPLLMPRGMKTTTTSVSVVRYDLRSGQTFPLWTTRVNKTSRFSQFNRIVKLDDWLIVRGVDGLLVFSMREKNGRYVTERDGLPGYSIGLCSFGNYFYLGFGGGNASVVRYDPRSNIFEIIASTRSVTPRNALDGLPFSIAHILPDTKRRCIWLISNNDNPTGGAWKYDPEQGVLTHTLPWRSLMLGWQTMCFLWNDGHEMDPSPGVGLISGPMREKSTTVNTNRTEEQQLMIDLINKVSNFNESGDGVYLNGRADTRLLQTPDGRPFPKVLELRRVFQGVMACCNGGEIYWIFEKSRTAFQPPGAPIRFAPDLSAFHPETIGTAQRHPTPVVEPAADSEQMIEALKTASRKYRERGEPHSDDFRKAIQTAAPLFRAMATSTQTGRVEISQYTLNSRSLGLDGLRFKTPMGLPSQLLWVFAKSKNLPVRCCFIPTQGTLEKEPFHCLHARSPCFHKFDKTTGPWPQEYEVFIQPVHIDLPPDREFLVWFNFENNRPVDMFIGILLVPIISRNPWVLEARALRENVHGHERWEYNGWQEALGLPWKAAQADARINK